MSTIHLKQLVPTFMALLTTLGCGVAATTNETDDSTTMNGGRAQTEDEISGSVTLAPVNGATVRVYALNADASRGLLLASATTDANGDYSIPRPKVAGPFEVVVRGGEYQDEASGEAVTRDEESELRAMFEDTDGSYLGVSALTEIAAERAHANAAQGLATAIAAANREVAALFGLGDVDPRSVKPVDLTNPSSSARSGTVATKLGEVNAMVSQMLVDNGLSPSSMKDFIEALALDFADGELDGLGREGALNFAISITPAQAMNGLEQARTNFLNGEQNLATIETEETSETETSSTSGTGSETSAATL